MVRVIAWGLHSMLSKRTHHAFKKLTKVFKLVVQIHGDEAVNCVLRRSDCICPVLDFILICKFRFDYSLVRDSFEGPKAFRLSNRACVLPGPYPKSFEER